MSTPETHHRRGIGLVLSRLTLRSCFARHRCDLSGRIAPGATPRPAYQPAASRRRFAVDVRQHHQGRTSSGFCTSCMHVVDDSILELYVAVARGDPPSRATRRQRPSVCFMMLPCGRTVDLRAPPLAAGVSPVANCTTRRSPRSDLLDRDARSSQDHRAQSFWIVSRSNGAFVRASSTRMRGVESSVFLRRTNHESTSRVIALTTSAPRRSSARPAPARTGPSAFRPRRCANGALSDRRRDRALDRDARLGIASSRTPAAYSACLAMSVGSRLATSHSNSTPVPRHAGWWQPRAPWP